MVERIGFDLLLRWCVGLGVDDPVWDAATFTKNHDRLLQGDMVLAFVRAHVAEHINGRRLAIDGRPARYPGHAISLRIGGQIKKAFGWAKTAAGMRKARRRGLLEVGRQRTLAIVAYNPVRPPKLLVVGGLTPSACPERTYRAKKP